MQAYLSWCEDRGITMPVILKPSAAPPVILSEAKDLPSLKVTFIADERGPNSHLDDELLSKMTTAMNLSAADYIIVNLADEPQRRSQLVVILGANTAQALFGDDFDFNAARGTWLVHQGLPTIVSYHPRDLRRTPASKRDAWNDLQAVMQRLTVTSA